MSCHALVISTCMTFVLLSFKTLMCFKYEYMLKYRFISQFLDLFQIDFRFICIYSHMMCIKWTCYVNKKINKTKYILVPLHNIHSLQAFIHVCTGFKVLFCKFFTRSACVSTSLHPGPTSKPFCHLLTDSTQGRHQVRACACVRQHATVSTEVREKAAELVGLG